MPHPIYYAANMRTLACVLRTCFKPLWVLKQSLGWPTTLVTGVLMRLLGAEGATERRCLEFVRSVEWILQAPPFEGSCSQLRLSPDLRHDVPSNVSMCMANRLGVCHEVCQQMSDWHVTGDDVSQQLLYNKRLGMAKRMWLGSEDRRRFPAYKACHSNNHEAAFKLLFDAYRKETSHKIAASNSQQI